MKIGLFLLFLIPLMTQAKVSIIVLDGGVESQHKLLKKHIKIINKDEQNLVEGDYDGIETSSDDSHGTHVAGIIVKEFSKVEIIPLKNLPGPTSSLQATIHETVNVRFNKALEFAIKYKIKLVNFSQVMGLFDEANLEMLKKAEAAGILVVAAVGNYKIDLDSRAKRLSKENKTIGSSEEPFIYPCGFNLSNVVCVGNYDKQGKKREVVSNFGSNYVDVFAYGQEILSSCNKGTMCRKSGSSMSTPRVTARLGKIWNKHPQWTYQQVKNQLLKELPQDSALKPFSKTGSYLD